MTIYSLAGLNYVKPSELIRKHPDSELSIEELKELANQPDRICPNCENPVWKYGQCNLCFSCTTGEANGSEDYELLEEV